VHIQIFKPGKPLRTAKTNVLRNHIPHVDSFSLNKEAKTSQKKQVKFLSKNSNLSLTNKRRLKVYAVNPYFPSSWSMEKQLNSISTHYVLLNTLPHFLNVSDGQTNPLINFDLYSNGTSLDCGLPKWPESEGEAALHLIKHGATVMTVPFTLGVENDELVIYVWSIQKPSADSSNLISIYKDFAGLRTQDLMAEMLRLLAKSIGAKKIFAMADESWNPKSQSLGNRVRFSYDDTWLSLSGVKLSNGFFDIPIEITRPAIETVPESKQSMVSKRYSILQNIAHTFEHSLPN
jgi:uncharacterized protein VirK/YbjX